MTAAGPLSSPRDTVLGELRTPISLNRYTYGANNPLAFWDPDGRISQQIVNDEINASDQINKYEQQKKQTARWISINDLSEYMFTGASASSADTATTEQESLIFYIGGTLGPRLNDDTRGAFIEGGTGRRTIAADVGKFRPVQVAWPGEIDANERLMDCPRRIFPNCHGPDHDAEGYAQQIATAAAESPTGKVDVIAHSYSAFELSIVLELFPEN